MKILTIVYSIGPGGTERAAVNYAIAYKRAGCDSRVWVLGEGHDRKDRLDEEQVMTYLDKRDNQHLQHAIEIENWKPDIIHIHTFDSRLSSLIGPLKKNGAKLVETNVFSRPRFSIESKQVDISFQLAYWGVWKYGKWMRNENGRPINLRLPYLIFEEDFGCVIENSRDQLCTQLGIPANAFIAARVGQSHLSKWDRKIFTIAKKVINLDRNIFFLFVGLPEALKEELATLPQNIRANIKSLDLIIGDEELTKFYTAIDVFVHISAIGESFGYVLAEAMICGCPVITLCTPLKDNAQFEVVGNNVGGYCVKDVDEFAERLLDMSKGRFDFNKAILRQHVVSRFSEKAVVTSLLDTYALLKNGASDILRKSEAKEFQIARDVVKEQLNKFGFRSLFIKASLAIIHLPVFYKLKTRANR